MTVAGAVLITVIVGAMAGLVLLGTPQSPEPPAPTAEDDDASVAYQADS